MIDFRHLQVSLTYAKLPFLFTLRFDRAIETMAKLRQDRSRGQKLSKTPSAARTGYWPGVEAVPFPSSQPMLVKNTKIVFGDESQDQVALPKFGHSKISQSGAKPTSSHNMKASSSSQSKVLSSKNDVNARLASNGELSFTSANRDAHGVKSPENSANDLSSPTMAKSTSQNSSRLINGSKQDQAPGSKVRDHNGNQQKKQPSQQSIEAEGSTPISPEVKSSSLQKLKDAKAAALEHKKQSNQPVSPVTNVFNAHSPPRTSSTTFATPSATLPPSPSTALRQAAQKLGSWRASPEILMYSSPLQPSAQSTKKKNKKRHSEPGHTTIIEAPKTYGPPPNPPSRELSITKKALKNAEVRISNVWGKQFEGQKLIIEPFKTFSSKTSTFDVDSSSEDEYLVKAKKGQSHADKMREKAKVKKEASAKKQNPGEQGWDVVLAEARNQAQRLERHRVEKDKLRNAATDSAKEKHDETGRAKKKKGKKEDKDEQAVRVSKKRKISETNDTNEQAENRGKRQKTEEASGNEKRHKKNKEKKQQHSSNEVSNADMSDSKTDERQNELTSKNDSIHAKPCTETPILTDLRQLIPKAVLNSAANALNDAEHCRIEELLARKKRKEFKKIERGVISLNDAIWQDLSVEEAQKNNLVEEVKIFSANDDAVVVRAAVSLIRALSQNTVLSACNNVPAGEAGKLGAVGH